MATPKQIDKLRTAAQVGVTISGATLIPAKMQDGTEAFKMSITELSPFLTDKGLRIGTTGIISGSLQDVKDAAATNTGIKLSNTTFEYTGIFTFASKTASTLIYLNGSKQVTSLANSAGVLTNDGAGNFSYTSPSASITIDTTAITSGTAGRLLFESATNKVTESANLAVNIGSGIFNIGYHTLVAATKRLSVGEDISADFNVVSATGNDHVRIGYDNATYLNIRGDVDGNADFTLNGGSDPLLRLYNGSIYARIRPRTLVTNAPGATPTVDADAYDFRHFTGLNAAITSMTTNLSGTPTEAQKLWLAFTDNGTGRAITWGASFENGPATLPTTTVASTRLDVGFIWNTVTSKWRCVAAG